ncbi:HAD-IB family phosphatase [Patescibacteria group bacterium]|nr:HAD-IB family phosphatase [Patescibacteria group bacterium]
MKKKVAIFDIDGTIFRSSLLIELVEAMIAEGLFPASLRKTYAGAYKKWLDRRDIYDKYINAVVSAYNKHIKGVDHKEFLKVARKVIAFHHNRVYRFTRDLVRDLKKKNYFLLAISHSPREIVQGFCKGLGFNKVYGRIYKVDSRGKFTREMLHLDLISDKAKVLARAVEKENLTLRGSVGVGDTESDIRFLKMVDRPICFNPNKKLYDHARRAGWEIVVERKDVIYKMGKNKKRR